MTGNRQDMGASLRETGSHPTGQAPSGLVASRFDPARGFMLKPYVVTVEGFGPFAYPAASRGKALAEAWGDYRICNDCTFKRFMQIARVRLSDYAPRFGEPITVGGRPAFYVGERGQYVRFVRPNETVTFLSHPADVAAIAIETAKPLRRETGSARKGESAGPKDIAQPQPHGSQPVGGGE